MGGVVLKRYALIGDQSTSGAVTSFDTSNSDSAVTVGLERLISPSFVGKLVGLSRRLSMGVCWRGLESISGGLSLLVVEVGGYNLGLFCRCSSISFLCHGQSHICWLTLAASNSSQLFNFFSPLFHFT